jgi:hypothetical protein
MSVYQVWLSSLVPKPTPSFKLLTIIII